MHLHLIHGGGGAPTVSEAARKCRALIEEYPDDPGRETWERLAGVLERFHGGEGPEHPIEEHPIEVARKALLEAVMLSRNEKWSASLQRIAEALPEPHWLDRPDR